MTPAVIRIGVVTTSDRAAAGVYVDEGTVVYNISTYIV